MSEEMAALSKEICSLVESVREKFANINMRLTCTMPELKSEAYNFADQKRAFEFFKQLAEVDACFGTFQKELTENTKLINQRLQDCKRLSEELRDYMLKYVELLSKT